MPTYSVKGPDGKTYSIEGPEGATREQVISAIQSQLSMQSAFRPRPAAKKIGGFWESMIDSAKTLGLGDEAAAFAANPTEENRRAFIAAGDSKFRSVGFGEGENWAAFKQLLGSSLGQMVAPVAAATAAVPTGPIGSVVAGFGASTAQYEIQNLLRQAQEQERAAAEGRAPEEVNLGKSLVASGLQAGLDVAQAGIFAKLLRAFPLARNLVLPEKEATEQAVEKIVRNYQAGKLTYKNGIARGALEGFAFEVPQEMAQQALERWQSGLSLTDDEAQEEYKQAAIGAAVLGPLIGGGAGVVGTARERAIAESEQGRRGVEAARQEAPPETGEEVGTTEEAAPPAPPEVEAAKPEEAAAPKAEPPAPAKTVRVYHSGSQGEGESGRWVSTNKTYASDYRPDLPLFYVDIPANDPRVRNLDYPEQGVEQGFTFNFELTPEEATQLKPIERTTAPPTAPEAKPVAAPTPEPDFRSIALEAIKTTPTIKAISEATGLNQPKAAAIMRGFVDEGIVERTGNKFKLIETAKPEEAKPVVSEVDPISKRIIETGTGSDFVKELYSSNPEDAIRENFDDLTVTRKGVEQSKNYIKNISQDLLRNKFGDKITLYRGLRGTEDKSPVLSYSLNKSTARFFAEQQGIRTGRIEEIEVPVSSILSYSEAIGRGSLAEEEVIIPKNAREIALASVVTPAPPTAPPEAPRGTEPAVAETVSGAGLGGAELPVSRAAAEGPSVAESGVERLGVPSPSAERVDEREEGVEPALTPAPPTPPTPPGPPPGGPPTPPTPPGPPPRGPTPAAPTPPIPPSRPSTPQQLKRDIKRALTAAVQPLMDRPGYSDSFAKKVIDALGNVPLNLRKAQFAIYSMPHMQQLLSTVLPYVKVLEKTNGLRAAQTSSALNKIAKNQTRWQEIIKRHPRAKWEQLKKVATLGTLYQVDPTSAAVKQLHNSVRSGARTVASLTPVEKVQYEIAAMYYSLPSDLRGILISDDGKSGIVPEYRKYRQQKFDALVKNWTKQGIPTTVIEKLRKEFNDPQNNLSFYIPLRRDQGVYWLKYVDANGNSVSKLFSNPVERSAFRQQIEAQGAAQVEETSRYSDIKGERAGKPPTGFLGEIVELLETSLPSTMGPGKNVIISEVYDIFLDYMPQNTLRQELSSRQVLDLGAGLKQFGVFGFNEDFLETYAKEAPRIVYQLNNLRWVLPIEDVMKKLAEQRDRYIGNYGNPAFMRGKLDIPPEQLNEAFDSIRKRIDFGYSPTYAPWVYNIATGNYIFSIAGNVSSALINTTTIPMLTIPSLAAKYGVMPTLRAVMRASAMFAKAPTEGGFTVGGVRVGDWSASHGATGEYRQFFKSLIDRGVIGAAAEQELLQAQRVQLSGYDSLGDKANYIAGYVFKNSERFNRETTLLASFMLAREKGKSFNDALEEAIGVNNDVNGAVLPASDSRLYQTNLGRVLLTFRKYILNSAILIANTFKDAVAKVEPNDAQQKLLRSVARRKLLGIYAGTYMVAGVGGMPLFGLAEVLAAMMMGDDDEPYDLQQEVYESLGELGLNGPVNALVNLDIASRTGFTDLLWRDDPKRLAEVGYITFGLEKLAGPTYSNLMNWQRGFGLMADGEIWRGTEALTPAAIRNALKATRYATEGALTKNGVPIEKDIGAWNSVMQVFGFAPADLATTQARVGAEYEISQKLRRRRTALYTQLYAAVSAGNTDAVREAYKDIAKFNRANPTIAINFDGIQQSFKQRDRRNAESIDGLYLEKNLRQATVPYVSSRD